MHIKDNSFFYILVDLPLNHHIILVLTVNGNKICLKESKKSLWLKNTFILHRRNTSIGDTSYTANIKNRLYLSREREGDKGIVFVCPSVQIRVRSITFKLFGKILK